MELVLLREVLLVLPALLAFLELLSIQDENIINKREVIECRRHTRVNFVGVTGNWSLVCGFLLRCNNVVNTKCCGSINGTKQRLHLADELSTLSEVTELRIDDLMARSRR